MMKKVLFLTLLLSIGLGSTAMAAFVDEFDVAHDYLTDGVTGTIWSGLMNDDNATTLDASITATGKLRIVSTGIWEGGTTEGPLLYKDVTGDFIAEIQMDPPTEAGANGGGLMVRLGDDTAGDGEDNMLLYWMMGWGVGSLFWPTDNDVRQELDITWEGADAHSYLRVERQGANFYWSRSYDGGTWDVLPSANPMVRSDMDVATLQVGVVQAYGDGSANVQYEYFSLREKVATLSGTTKVSEEGATSTTITVDLIGPAQTAQVDVVISQENTPDPNDILLNGTDVPSLTLPFPVGVTQQTFTVQAVDDTLQEGPELVGITADVTSTDSNYDGNYGSAITIEIADNDQGTTVTDLGDGLLVDEDGLISDTFDVSLNLPLTAEGTVTVDITTDGQTQVSPVQLTFDETDYNVPQPVTVTGVDDTDLETDPHTGIISFSITSDDPAYAGDPYAADISASIQENECGAWDYGPYDFNEDCVVNLEDLAVVASEWGECTMPHVGGCIDVR